MRSLHYVKRERRLRSSSSSVATKHVAYAGGILTGDVLLRLFAEGCELARSATLRCIAFGGDEFVVFDNNLRSEADIARVMDHIMAVATGVYDLGDDGSVDIRRGRGNPERIHDVGGAVMSDRSCRSQEHGRKYPVGCGGTMDTNIADARKLKERDAVSVAAGQVSSQTHRPARFALCANAGAVGTRAAGDTPNSFRAVGIMPTWRPLHAGAGLRRLPVMGRPHQRFRSTLSAIRPATVLPRYRPCAPVELPAHISSRWK